MSKFVESLVIPEEVEAIQYQGSYELMRAEMSEEWGHYSLSALRSVYVEGGITTEIKTDDWFGLRTDDWVVKRGARLWVLTDGQFREAYRPMDEEADDALEVSVADITEETDSEFGDTLGEIDLLDKLTEILNKTKTTEASGTHDFVLAQYLIGTLNVFEETIKMRAGARRERWQFDTPNEGE